MAGPPLLRAALIMCLACTLSALSEEEERTVGIYLVTFLTDAFCSAFGGPRYGTSGWGAARA